MARRRRTSSERPPSVKHVDRHAEIRLLLDKEAAENDTDNDATEYDTDNDATVVRVQRRALGAPHSPLVILRAWWWEEATMEETGTKYWATSDVIDRLAVGDVTRLEELLGGDAKAGWAKAAKTFAECMGWSKFSQLQIYAMFGDMLYSRQFMDCTRELIGMLKSRKKAVCRLRAVRNERRAGLKKGRNINSKADWVAGDAKAALDAFKAGTLKAGWNDDVDEEEMGEHNGDVDDEDSRADATDEEENNEDSGADGTAEKEDGENTEDDGFEIRGNEDDGHGSEASVECEQGRGGQEPLLDQSSFNGLDDGAEGARSESESPDLSEFPHEEVHVQDVPHSTLTSRAKCTTTSAAFTTVSSLKLASPFTKIDASAPKPASPFTKIDASSPKPDDISAINLNAITSTANDSSSRTADMRKRELSSMSDNQPNAKRRLGQQIQIAPVATPPPQCRDLESWLTAVSAGKVGEEVGDDGERGEDDFKVLHRDLQDTTARPHANRTCIIYSNGDERAAAAYVDHRTNTPVWQTYVPVESTVKANALAEVILREFDGQPTVLDFTPACTSTTDWSLVAVLTCLCMHRPIPDGAAAYPPIWQYALRTLVDAPEAADLDTDSAIATVADVLPSGDAVSESVSSQPYSRFESAHVRRTQAIRKALKEKIALAKALLVDAALIASLASVALDRLGPGDDSDNAGSIQQQIDCHKASLKAQRDLVNQSARNQLARTEVSRLEALLKVLEKSLEAQPVSTPGNNPLRVVQRHMQHLAGFIAAREIEYTGELSLND